MTVPIKELRCQEYRCLDNSTLLVWSYRDKRVYTMCEACASHSVKNRGMQIVNMGADSEEISNETKDTGF